MRRSSAPFARARALAAALQLISGMALAQQQAALAALPPYKSRGKGGKRPHRSVGTKACQRAALKARNVRANKEAHRG